MASKRQLVLRTHECEALISSYATHGIKDDIDQRSHGIENTIYV